MNDQLSLSEIAAQIGADAKQMSGWMCTQGLRQAIGRSMTHQHNSDKSEYFRITLASRLEAGILALKGALDDPLSPCQQFVESQYFGFLEISSCQLKGSNLLRMMSTKFISELRKLPDNEV